MEEFFEMEYSLGQNVVLYRDGKGREARVSGVQDFDNKNQSYLIDFTDKQTPFKEWVRPGDLVDVEWWAAHLEEKKLKEQAANTESATDDLTDEEARG